MQNKYNHILIKDSKGNENLWRVIPDNENSRRYLKVKSRDTYRLIHNENIIDNGNGIPIYNGIHNILPIDLDTIYPQGDTFTSPCTGCIYKGRNGVCVAKGGLVEDMDFEGIACWFWRDGISMESLDGCDMGYEEDYLLDRNKNKNNTEDKR